MTFFRRVADRASEPGDEDDPQGDLPREPRYLIVARFSVTDAILLRELASQVAELVGGAGETDETRDFGDAGESGEAGLADDLADALGLTEDASLPDDPALARLLPDAYPDDAEASGEFRRYTERDLRAGKVAAAETVLATLPAGGGGVSLSQPQAEAWLRALNDMRLALGVRLGVTEDMHEEMDLSKPDDPRYGLLALYDWLTHTQDSLLHALW